MQSDLKLMTILFRTIQAIESVVKKDVAIYGLNTTEFAVLEVLYHKGKLSVQNINAKVLIANSSMTYCLDKLEKKAYVTRQQDKDDKRTFYVDLTKKGKQFVREVFPKHYETLKSIFKVLTEDEKNHLRDLLKKIGYNAVDLQDRFSI